MPPPSSPRLGPCAPLPLRIGKEFVHLVVRHSNSCGRQFGPGLGHLYSGPRRQMAPLQRVAPGVEHSHSSHPACCPCGAERLHCERFFDEPHALHARKKVNPLPNSVMCAWIRVLPQRGCCDLNVFAAAPLRHHRQLHGSVFARPRQLLLPSNDDSAFSIQRGAVSVVCNHRLLSVFQVWLIGVYRI